MQLSHPVKHAVHVASSNAVPPGKTVTGPKPSSQYKQSTALLSVDFQNKQWAAPPSVGLVILPKSEQSVAASIYVVILVSSGYDYNYLLVVS